MEGEDVFSWASAEELELALQTLVNEALEEVMNSTNLQPSVPGIVCEVISDIVQSVSPQASDVIIQSVSPANDTAQTVSEAADDNTDSAAVNGSMAYANPSESASHNAQVSQLITSAK